MPKDAVTHRNAALVEQAGAAALLLEAQAGELTAAVSLYKLAAPASPMQHPTSCLNLLQAS